MECKLIKEMKQKSYKEMLDNQTNHNKKINHGNIINEDEFFANPCKYSKIINLDAPKKFDIGETHLHNNIITNPVPNYKINKYIFKNVQSNMNRLKHAGFNSISNNII